MDALFRMSSFTGSDLQSLLRSSYNEIHAQSHVLVDRSKVFAYHQYLLCHKLDQIVPLGMDYLLGYIQVRVLQALSIPGSQLSSLVKHVYMSHSRYIVCLQLQRNYTR